MNHSTNTKNLNKYDFYDYKKPLTFKETDYRTATIRSHQFYFPKDVKDRRAVTANPESRVRKPIVIRNTTETSDEFPFKFPFKYEPRAADRIYQSNRPEFMRHFDEKVRKQLPKPINEYQTTNLHEYVPKEIPPEPQFVQECLEKHLERPTHETFTHEKGFSKYLDPFVSVTHMDHIPFTTEMQNGIAKKDAITVWDWLQYPKTNWGFGLKDYPHIECRKVEPMFDKSKFSQLVTDRELPKRKKFVPNNSFQTETRQNYQIPVEKKFLYDTAHGQALTYQTGIEEKETEYSVIGSGKRIQSYLEAEKPKIVHYKSGDCR